MALTDKLVSYYKLDESSGDAIDTHSTNDGTVTGPAQDSEGLINTGYDFERGDGADRITFPSMPTSWTQFAISFWIKPESISQTMRLFDQGNTDMYIEIQSNNTIIFRHTDLSAGTTTSTSTISSGVWQNIVCTYDGSNTKITINNVDAGGGQAATGTMTNSTSTMTCGVRASDNGNEYDGLLDEIAIFDVGLTDS